VPVWGYFFLKIREIGFMRIFSKIKMFLKKHLNFRKNILIFEKILINPISLILRKKYPQTGTHSKISG